MYKRIALSQAIVGCYDNSMFKVEKRLENGMPVIIISGTIDEDSNLSDSVGELQDGSTIDCSGVIRINSMGIKAWVLFLQKFKGARLTMRNCSPVIIEQANLFRNFFKPATVESFQLPFFCESCSLPFTLTMTAEEARKSKNALPMPKCPKCAAPCTFDENPEEYFAFLKF